jgi:hypothetical protein
MLRGKIAVAPVVVGAVFAIAILSVGYLDGRQPQVTDCFGVPACEAAQHGGLHVGYVIAAIVVLCIAVVIGLPVERSNKPRPR